MERVDFCSVTKIIRENYKAGMEPKQIVFIGDLFNAYKVSVKTEFEVTQACRWLKGQTPISSNVGMYYTLDPDNQKKLKADILNNIIPDIHDIEKTAEELRDLVVQDISISESKKEEILIEVGITTDDKLASYITALLVFCFERPFEKRDDKKNKLLTTGKQSPALYEYIYTEALPEPCPHFLGRDKELEELEKLLEEETKVFVRGIAGIGKSELVRAYIKKKEKDYTNVIYLRYSGNLYKDIAGLDFADDKYDASERERYKKHARFLRSLKEDTLIVIDNFDTTPNEESLLAEVLRYQCRMLFTTRSRFEKYATLELSEINDPEELFRLSGCVFDRAEKCRQTVCEIIETVHSHTFAVELAARLLQRGILEPEELLEKLKNESVKLNASDNIDSNKDGVPKKDTYYGHIHTLFSLYQLREEQIDVMRCMTLVPPAGVSARVFARWMGAEDTNTIQDLIETGFIKEETEFRILLHPMMRDIAMADTSPSVTGCRSFLDHIESDLRTFEEFTYYPSLIRVAREIMARITIDDVQTYFFFLSAVYDKFGEYRYLDERDQILTEMEQLLEEESIDEGLPRAILLSHQSQDKARRGDYEGAIVLGNEALNIVKNDPDQVVLACNICSNISHIFTVMGDLKNSEKYHEQAEVYLKKIEAPDVKTIINVSQHRAFLSCQKLSYDESVNALMNAMDVLKEKGLFQKKAEAYLEEAIGIVDLNWGNMKDAEKHFDKARFAYADIWNADADLVEIREGEMKAYFPAAGKNIAKKLSDHGVYPIII